MTLLEILLQLNTEWRPEVKVIVQQPRTGSIYGYSGTAENLHRHRGVWVTRMNTAGRWVQGKYGETIAHDASRSLVSIEALKREIADRALDVFKELDNL